MFKIIPSLCKHNSNTAFVLFCFVIFMNRNRPNLPKLNALDKVDIDSLCYCSIRITNIFVDLYLIAWEWKWLSEFIRIKFHFNFWRFQTVIFILSRRFMSLEILNTLNLCRTLPSWYEHSNRIWRRINSQFREWKWFKPETVHFYSSGIIPQCTKLATLTPCLIPEIIIFWESELPICYIVPDFPLNNMIAIICSLWTQ